MLIRALAFLSLSLIFANALTGCGGAEERKAEYLERGKKYYEEKNFDKAKVEFKNVLQIDPKMAKPYYYLGQIEESKQNWRGAFGLYQKAVELDAGDLDAKTKLAKYYLLAKEQGKADELVTAILQARPGDVQARVLKAAISNLKGERDAAIAELESVIAEHPDHADAFLVLAMVYGQKNDTQAAVRILQQGLGKNAGNAALLLSLAKLNLQLNQPQKTEENLKQLIAAEPGNLDHRGMLAQLYIQLKRFDEAEEVLHAAIAADPKDARRYALLSDFLIQNRKPDQAIKEMSRAVASHPEDAAFRFGLARLYEQLNQADKAQATYRDIISEIDNQPDVLKAKNQLAALALAKNQPDEAMKLLDEVLKDNPQDNQALLLKGRIALAKKDAQTAIASFRAVLKDQPDSAEVLTLLAGAHMLDGKPALARESLEKATAAKPEDFEARKRLVEFLVQEKDTAAALEKTNEYLKLTPQSLEGLNLKADLLALSGNQAELETVLRQMKKDFPDKPIGAFRLGQLYQSQKKFDLALAEYESSLQKSENDYEPLKAIVGAYLDMQQPDKALARLRKVIADNPRHPTAHQLLAMYHLNRKQEDEGIKALKQAIEINPRWPLPYINLASVYEQQGKPEWGIKTYEEALKLFPDDPDLLMKLARLHEIDKDYAGAIRRYEAVLSKNPDNLLVINNLASLLSIDASNQANMERARGLAKALENSSEPAFMDTLAWIDYQNNDYDKALPRLQKVIEKAAQEPIFQYHLGMVYFKKGEMAAAKEHLNKAVEPGKSFIGVDEAKETLKKL